MNFDEFLESKLYKLVELLIIFLEKRLNKEDEAVRVRLGHLFILLLLEHCLHHFSHYNFRLVDVFFL